jgi:2-polyprenyl-3-methyl-5-hydroxy-6-metoxy-1,4-benzoquinol methylase
VSYQDRTIDSPSRLRRFSHRKRFQIATELVGPLVYEQILDYGTGDGYFLRQLATANPDAQIVGYEPNGVEVSECYQDVRNVHVVSTVRQFSPGSFNKISCLEVMEHLLEEDLDDVLADMRRLLCSSGRVIISVPIEIRGAALVKYAVRAVLGHLEPGMTISSTFRCALGMKVERHREATCYGHKGFDYRKLEEKIKSSGFSIESRVFSPVPALRGVLNSQVFYRLKTNGTEGS